jgi:parvulin-like peptidyl-prolyl isomerase
MADKEKNLKNIKAEKEESEALKHLKANPMVFIGTIVVLVLTVVTFVLVPALVPGTGGGLGGNALTFGYWNKKPITYTPDGYFAQMRNYYSQYAQYMGLQNDYQIWQYAFQAAVVHEAAMEDMDKTGWIPPNSSVDKEVAALPQFKDSTGKFSITLYQKTSKSDLLRLWNDQKAEMRMERWNDDASDYLVPKTAGSFIGSMAADEREFQLVSFPFSSYPDSEVASYANSNPDKFKSTHLSQLTVADEKDAQAILGQIKAKTVTFGDAAKTHSTDAFAERNGDAGVRLAYEIEEMIPDKAALAKVMALKKGEISDVIKVPSGYAIFQAEDAAQPLDLSKTENQSKVRNYMMSNERGKIEDFMTAQAQVFVADAAEKGFDATVTARNMKSEKFGPLPINYGDTQLFATVASFNKVTELIGAGNSSIFWKTAWATPLGKLSKPFALGTNVLVLLPTAPDSASFDKDKTVKQTTDMFTGYWAAQDASGAVNTAILSSPKFKDNFFLTYFKLFNPANNAANSSSKSK